MREAGRSAVIFVAAVLAASTALARDDFNGTFTATAVVETSQGTRQMAFTIVVSSTSSLADAQPLKRILAEGGQQALVNSIRGRTQGKFMLGVVEYPIDLIVAEKIDGAVRYVVIAARNLQYEELTDGKPSVDFPFTVLAFDVPDFGSGEGRIFTQAALVVAEDGHVQAEQYHGKFGRLQDVQPAD